MKKISVLALLLVALFSTSSQARTRSSGSEDHPWSLGFTTLALNTGTVPAGATPGFTAIFDLGSENEIQAIFGFPSAMGPILYGGGLFKHTVSSYENVGLHVGGGVLLGAVAGAFAMNIDGIIGFHLTVPGATHLRFDLDGGPAFSIIASSANFGLGALSTALGLSAVYTF